MAINYTDAEQQRIYHQKVSNLNNWNRRVKEMKNFVIPPKYQMENVKDKYARFTGFIRNWVEELLATDKDTDVGDVQTNHEIYNLSWDRSDLMNDWWTVARKVGSGKQVFNNLPKFDPVTEENKKYAYDAFLPAYRALKESFEKRSVFEFLFNHKQYVAERDSMRAIEGILSTLTGDGKDAIQARLDEYVSEIPTANLSEATRLLKERIERQMEEKDRVGLPEDTAIELQDILLSEQEISASATAEQDLTVSEENAEPKQEGKPESEQEKARRTGVIADNRDQLDKVLDDDAFQEKFVAQMKEAMKKECHYLPEDKQKTMIELIAKNRLIYQAAQPFNQEMDEAIERGENNLNAVAINGVKSVYEQACACTRLLSISSLKDQLIVAQRFSDIVLNMATPIGFQKEAFGIYGKGFMLMNTNLDMIKDVVKEHLTGKENFSDEQIEKAYNQAQTEFDLEMKRVPMKIEGVDENATANVAEKHEISKQIDPLVNVK